jgi:hypothetical protein
VHSGRNDAGLGGNTRRSRTCGLQIILAAIQPLPTLRAMLIALNKRLEGRGDQKTKKPHVKVRDLAPRKDSKGGISSPAIPTSLHEFLKRDSIQIER